MAEAESRGDEPLVRDVQMLSRRLGESGAVEYLQACARKTEAIAALGAPETIEPAIRALMQLPDESVEDYIAHYCGDDRFDCDLLRAVADANRRWGTQTGLGHANVIDEWLALTPIERAANLTNLRRIVLTDKDTLKVSVGQTRAEPHYEAQAGRLANLLGELLRIQNGARLAADMAAGLRAGQAFADAYTRAKRAAGVADFNDLIDWTRELLRKPGMGDWVRYKLDRQVDHLLVDEAQDTNAAQWEIIERMVEEFFTGSGESDERRRTLFMVGDFKQAIYGFQGTDPAQFREARETFKARADALRAARIARRAQAAGARVPRPVDRRQLPLGPADSRRGRCRGRDRRARGDRADAAARRTSRIIRIDPAGSSCGSRSRVEDSAEEASEGEERWIDLRDRYYADALAGRIRDMVEEAPVLASTGRPLTPGDILVLVRSRGELASLIVARLFSAGVPVAGVDRLHLHEPLAVQDLLAACRFAVQPNDDLNLACLLVSPLIGWDQEQLRALAFGRRAGCGASSAAGPTTTSISQRACALVRFAADRRFHPAVALPRDDPVGTDRRAAQAVRPARNGVARRDRRADEQRARIRAQRDRLARPVHRLVLARRRSTSSAIRASRPTKSG